MNLRTFWSRHRPPWRQPVGYAYSLRVAAVAVMAFAGLYGLAVLCYFMACATVGCDPGRAPWPHR